MLAGSSVSPMNRDWPPAPGCEAGQQDIGLLRPGLAVDDDKIALRERLQRHGLAERAVPTNDDDAAVQ